MNVPRIGCHLSLGAKPDRTYAEAAAHGVQCAQIFASSPGAWKPPLEFDNRHAIASNARARAGIDPLLVHAIYLINLATDDATLGRRAVDSLRLTLTAAQKLGALAVITHIGSHGGRGFEAVAELIASRIMAVLDGIPEEVHLALENSAGAGNLVGAPLEELGTLINLCNGHPQLKVALDTAHLCGAGWNFSLGVTSRELAHRIEAVLGPDRLLVIHANDSKVSPGARRDRHEAVGKGHIGMAGFAALLQQPLLRSVPWIAETPDLGGTESAERRFRSVRVLRALAEGAPLPTYEPEIAESRQKRGPSAIVSGEE